MLPQILKKITLLLAACVATASLSSCRKNKQPANGYKILDSAPLNIGAGVSTRTFFGSKNFNDTSNRARILDYITLEGQSENTQAYIDDELYSDKAGSMGDGTQSEWTWSLSGKAYFWTDSGTHRFISWLSYDAALDLSSNAFFGSEPALDSAHEVLGIPAKTFNASTPQFDFIYSNAALRSMDVASPDYSSVELAYKHLFTAFSVGIRNWTSTPVTVKSFQLINMPDTKTGVNVTFRTALQGGSASNAEDVSASSGNPGKVFFSNAAYNVTLNEGEAIDDLFNPGGSSANYMMWPVTSDEIGDPNPGVDANGRVMASTDAPQMVITYNIAGSDITRYVPFPDMDWQAGKIYHFELQFVQKEMRLTFETLPWDYEELNLNYKKDAVQGAQVAYDSNSCVLDNDNYSVTYNGSNIRASFGITLPQNATWLLSMTGDVGYFRLRFDQNSSYFKLVHGEGAANPNTSTLSGPVKPEIEGGTIWFEIVPLTSLDRSVDRKIVLDFKVRTASGQIVDAQSELNRGGYEIILPKQ